MREPEHRDRGYTLTELLIVIAIFALLTGVAIPTIARVGGFLSDDPDLAARELYSSLRGAKVHAATYHVDTAVVYGLESRKDSITGADTLIIGSYGLARRMGSEQAQALGLTENQKKRAFVLIDDIEARFRKLPAKSCILSVKNLYSYDQSQEMILADGSADSRANEGFYHVLLFDVDGTAIAPNVSLAGFPDQFPAHVFLPSGVMEPQDSLVARFTLNIASTPDSSPEDRFSNVDSGELKVPVRIELFRTTGRVKFTS